MANNESWNPLVVGAENRLAVAISLTKTAASGQPQPLARFDAALGQCQLQADFDPGESRNTLTAEQLLAHPNLPYFYFNDAGNMVFRGERTAETNTYQFRTELRAFPEFSSANRSRMYGEMKLSSSTLNEYTFMQIHEKPPTGSVPPPLRLAWEASRTIGETTYTDHLFAVFHRGGSTYERIPLAARSDDWMAVEVLVEDGELYISIDGVQAHTETVTAWAGLDLYFKQGIYCTGSATAVGVATNEARALTLVVDVSLSDIVISGTIEHGQTITITDSLDRFGAKPAYHKQLFIESATSVYEDNVLNNTHVGLEVGDWVPCVSTGGNPPNGGVSGAVFQGAFAQVSNTQRHPRVSSCFSGQAIQIPGATAESGQLTWPTMFGANRDTPYGEYFRASWWLWIGHKNCRGVKYNTLSGTFDTGSNTSTSAFDQGEPFTLDGGITGYLVYVDTVNERVYINITSGDAGSTSLNGKTLTGSVSGASCVLDTTTGYLASGSQKIYRILEEPTQNPVGRRHMINMSAPSIGTWKVAGWDGVGPENVANNYGMISFNSRNWVRVKVEADYRDSQCHVSVSINGQKITNSDLAKSLYKSATHGPTLANWGYECSVNNYDCALFGELDACNSPLEVEIGDNADYENCTNVESCRIVAWDSGQVQVSLNQGGFSNLSGKFLFFRNEDGLLFGGGIPLEVA